MPLGPTFSAPSADALLCFVVLFLLVFCFRLFSRALMYHSRMLRAAKEIGNVNEFVYLAKEISRMLKEEVSKRIHPQRHNC